MKVSFQDLKTIFGDDVTFVNLSCRVDELLNDLDAIIYAEDLKNYPKRYLEISLRFRLNLTVFKFEIIPLFGESLFSQEIEKSEIHQICRLFKLWKSFFFAKEIPFNAGRTKHANSICVEINLDFPESDILKEVTAVIEKSKNEQRWNRFPFRFDSYGRVVDFDFPVVLRALEDYEVFMLSKEKIPTTAARQACAKNFGEVDLYIRQFTRNINENLDKYLFWDTCFDSTFEEVFSEEILEFLSEEEIDLLKVHKKQ